MSEVALTVEAPGVAVDVVADGSASLALLLPALAEAAGVADPRGWQWWDGGRALDLSAGHGLDDVGVLAGSRLRLVPPPGPG